MTKVWSLAVLCLLPLVAHAQETTAGGTLATEASWSALQALITKTSGDLDIVRIDVNASKNCGQKNQIWNPDEGCVNTMSNCKLETVTASSPDYGEGGTQPARCPHGYAQTGTNGGSTYDFNICSRIVCK